jgi:tetratricopeptide (TPR) repeat protein
MAGEWAVALVLGAGAVAMAQTAWTRLPHPHPLEELSYYPSGRHLKAATLGHAETVADLAWLRAVQYYGAHRMNDNQFVRMGHLFDILTSLSPRFEPAYVFGGFALAQEGFDFPAAEALMLKGIDANPTSGMLAFQLGFLYYVRPGGRDLRRAAEMFERAARQPDPPPQAERFAAFAHQNAGDLRVAYSLWSRVAETSTNQYLREMAAKEMARITDAIASGRAEQARSRLATPRVVVQPAQGPDGPAPGASPER